MFSASSGRLDSGAPVERPVLDAITDMLEKIRQESVTFLKNVKLLGTPKDSMKLRKRMKVQRTRIMELNKEIGNLFRKVPTEKELKGRKLMEQWQAAFESFKQLSKQSLQLERQNPLPDSKDEDFEPEVDITIRNEEAPGVAPAPDPLAGKLHEVAFDDDLRLDTAILKERNEAIKEIEDEMKSLNEAFVDIADMIHSQGEDVATIEANIEVAAAETTAGVDELHKAEKYARSARSKTCCILVIIVIICAVIAAGFGLGFGLKK
eukprot:TRINITY_DN17198_c0_g1_i1.p1 TRINITY_DN17198_c0_g1~~TRINITY_DN17198_c0_g1_i1.p1  ORF type:complete len:280 (-),score=21.49 TRINITY_DN17198_c0_g1_i1:69-860(-)